MELIAVIKDKNVKGQGKKTPDHEIELSFPNVKLSKKKQELFVRGLFSHMTQIPLKQFYLDAFGGKPLSGATLK
jgi:hypothetical protein